MIVLLTATIELQILFWKQGILPEDNENTKIIWTTTSYYNIWTFPSNICFGCQTLPKTASWILHQTTNNIYKRLPSVEGTIIEMNIIPFHNISIQTFKKKERKERGGMNIIWQATATIKRIRHTWMWML